MSRIASAILAVLLVACAPAATPAGVANPTSAPAPPQQLRVGSANVLANLDPHSNAGSYNGIKYTLFDTITRIDEKGNVGPWLALSWKSVDPTTWEFTLRDGVKFSNGEAMDAAAIKFSIDRLVDPANKLALAGRIPLVNGAAVVSPAVVRITTSRPDAILPARLAAIFAVPPAEVTRLGADEFGRKPIGTGPFKVTELVADSRLVVERYPDSWRKTGLEKITFLHLPEASTRLAALRSGEVQVLSQPPLDQLPILERENYLVSSTNYARVHVADFDLITEDTPLRDKRVRQALNYAVDKDAILKQVYGGRGRVVDGQLVGPIGYGYDPSLKPYPYDVATAKRLLAEAGYPNGFTIKMETPTSSFLNSREQATAIQGYFREVGVTVQLDALEQGIFLDRFYNRNGQKRAPIFAWSPNYFPAMDADFTLQWYITNSQKKVYSNPEFDRLYAASTVELDPARRLTLIKQLSAILRDDAAVLFIIEPDDLYVITKQIQGFAPRADGEVTYDGVSITR